MVRRQLSSAAALHTMSTAVRRLQVCGFKCLSFGIKSNLCFPKDAIQYKAFDSQGESLSQKFLQKCPGAPRKTTEPAVPGAAHRASLCVTLSVPLSWEMLSLPGSACAGSAPKKAQSIGLHCQLIVCLRLFARPDSPSVYTTKRQATPA